MAITVTIFMSDSKWLSGENCFDYRTDTQILPRGSVVCGFLLYRAGELHQLLDQPNCTENQEKQWVKILEEARSIILYS